MWRCCCRRRRRFLSSLMSLSGPDGAGLFLSKTNTLLDKAALTYAEALEGQTAGVPQLETCTMPVSAHNDSNLKMGRALKTSASKAVSYTHLTLPTKLEV